MAAVVEQLGGGRVAEADGWPLFTWPTPPGTEYVFPHTCHLDAYGDPWQPFMLGATAYLYDVAERGGGFGYWPKSHLSTHQYFLEDPEQIDGRFQQKEGWSWAEFSDRSPEPARQFVGKAGDVIFWHNFIVHGASINVRPEPRFGMFVLFFHRQQAQIKHEVPEDLWKYWAI